MTHITPAVEEVIKTDFLGRTTTSAARRESMFKEFERSEMSGKKFAELAGIKYQAFCHMAAEALATGPIPRPAGRCGALAGGGGGIHHRFHKLSLTARQHQVGRRQAQRRRTALRIGLALERDGSGHSPSPPRVRPCRPDACGRL
jgi:hypothetical protein